MTRDEIVNLLEIVISAYPNAKINDAGAMVTAWEMCLGDFSAESVYKAARLHMNTNKYFPTPADIRSNIVRAEIVYRDSEIDGNRLEAKCEPSTAISETEEQYLDDFCKWIGLGYPNDIED